MPDLHGLHDEIRDDIALDGDDEVVADDIEEDEDEPADND